MHGNEMLVLRRSARVSDPHTWATPGGIVEPGEDDLEAALREVDEEIVNAPQRYVITGEYQFVNPKMRYTMFVAHVPKRFTPELNWENDDFKWVKPNQMSRLKLHPGFRAGLKMIKELEKDAIP